MSSGVAVNNTCIELFQELKLKKKYKFIVFALNDANTEIVVEKASESGSYDDFIESLPPDSCRYAVYDFEYEKPGEGTRHKICFFTWTPDVAKVKAKMVYASSKDAIRKKLDAIAAEIQGTELSEISYEYVLDKLSRASQ